MIKRVFLTENAITLIKNEIGDNPTVETGGALVGYYADKSLVITHASGPGPRAVLTSASVLIDGKYTTAFCRHFMEVSTGCLYYVGDWHIHLTNDLRPSVTDRSAMATMLKANSNVEQELVSAIFFKDLSTMKVYSVDFRNRFKEIDVVISSNPECILPFL